MADPSPIPTITGNPGLDSLIRSGLLTISGAASAAIVTWLSAHSKIDPNVGVLIGTLIFTILSSVVVAAWGYFKGTQIGKVVEQVQVEAVQAGINLTGAGKALDATGKTVAINDGTTPPLPVTPTTAKEIVKAFGSS